MTEKPLHVRVAEALGWTAHLSKHGHFIVTHGDGERCEEAFGRYDPEARYDSRTGLKLPERTEWWEDCSHVPRYDTDWSVTGPLIEKYRITLLYLVNCEQPTWEAMEDACTGHDGELWNDRGIGSLSGPGYEPPKPSSGPTPMIAVCLLILALKEAGKLDA